MAKNMAYVLTIEKVPKSKMGSVDFLNLTNFSSIVVHLGVVS